MRRLLLLLLKAAISILLLYLSLRSVNLGVVGERLSRLDPYWIAAAICILASQIVLVAVRWREIARAGWLQLPMASAVQISFIAAFFSQVLPSTVGGDGARIWLLARKGGGWASATYSVLIDRIAGVFVLALIVIGCLPWTLDLVRDPIARAVLIIVGCGFVAGAVAFMAIGFLPGGLLERWKLTRHLVEMSRMAWRLCRNPRSIAIVGLCSISIHVLTVTAAWCCVKSFAAPVSFAQVLYLMPPVLLFSTLPISIAGWGVRESSMVVAFAYAGLVQSDGLTLSILFGALTFLVGVAGGIVWIASGFTLSQFRQSRNDEAIADDR